MKSTPRYRCPKRAEEQPASQDGRKGGLTSDQNHDAWQGNHSDLYVTRNVLFGGARSASPRYMRHVSNTTAHVKLSAGPAREAWARLRPGAAGGKACVMFSEPQFDGYDQFQRTNTMGFESRSGEGWLSFTDGPSSRPNRV